MFVRVSMHACLCVRLLLALPHPQRRYTHVWEDDALIILLEIIATTASEPLLFGRYEPRMPV